MSFEAVVRPASGVAVLKEKPDGQRIATQDDEAYIAWGRGSLNLVERSQSFSTGTGNDFNWEEQFPEMDPPVEPTFLFDEVARMTHVVRITQAGTPENYVDVDVIDAIAFKGPGGTYIYRFTNAG